MNTRSQVRGTRAPVFGIASLAASLVAIGAWFGLRDPIPGVYAVLVLTLLGFSLGIIGSARQETYRFLSRFGVVMNGGGFLYVFLGLFA